MTKILILDDDSDQRADIRAAAEEAGFVEPSSIIEAATPEEALEYFELGPDIAVIDLHLGPGLESAGLRVIKACRSKLPDCRIIALTMKLDNQAGVQSLVHGADHFISGKWRHVNWCALLTEELSIYKALHEERGFPLAAGK